MPKTEFCSLKIGKLFWKLKLLVWRYWISSPLSISEIGLGKWCFLFGPGDLITSAKMPKDLASTLGKSGRAYGIHVTVIMYEASSSNMPKDLSRGRGSSGIAYWWIRQRDFWARETETYQTLQSIAIGPFQANYRLYTIVSWHWLHFVSVWWYLMSSDDWLFCPYLLAGSVRRRNELAE